VKHFHFEAVVSQFDLSTCLLGCHGSVPTCLCLTLVILEGSTTCNAQWPLEMVYLLIFLSLFVSAIFRGYMKSFCTCKSKSSTTTFDLSVIYLDFLRFFNYSNRISSYVTEDLWSRRVVDSLVLNITITYSFPRGSSAPSAPLPHVSDDSFSSLDPIPSDFLGFLSLPWPLFTQQRFGTHFYLWNARNFSRY
jgi:hypothetical protein